jgi:hypothetical protein
MKVTDKKFLNVHQTIGPMNHAGGGSGAGTAGKTSSSSSASGDDLSYKTADRLLVRPCSDDNLFFPPTWAKLN